MNWTEIRGRCSRTMKEQKNKVQKENRFLQYVMVSVRWYEFVEIMRYKVVGLEAKSLMLYIFTEKIIPFIVILFVLCSLFLLILLNGRRRLLRPQVSLDTLELNVFFFFLNQICLEHIDIHAVLYCRFKISFIMLKYLYHLLSHSVPFKNGLYSMRQFMKKEWQVQCIPQVRTNCKFDFSFLNSTNTWPQTELQKPRVSQPQIILHCLLGLSCCIRCPWGKARKVTIALIEFPTEEMRQRYSKSNNNERQCIFRQIHGRYGRHIYLKGSCFLFWGTHIP